ncbi:MAG: leucine-rich repeat protein [Clostridium sp.]|nr:leucine-rich repeat protein [Lachnoclostridium sp.]MCM1253952.1 leucine-rich repeat protein [Clostridium sp.]
MIKKKKEKVWRRLMALLAAVCMFGSIPYMPVYASTDINVIGMETEDTEILEQEKEDDTKPETGEKDDTGLLKDTEETNTEDEENPEDTEKETDDIKKDEPQKEKEPEKNPEEEKEENPEEPGKKEDTDGEDGEKSETEELDEVEAEETEDIEEAESGEENTEESIMLLDDAAEGEENVVDASYTDANGIIYHYYGYEDGTANIYELENYWGSFGVGYSINIPAYIDGYMVTKLTFISDSSAKHPVVTIPETVTYMGDYAFRFMRIVDLYYNAEWAEVGTYKERGGCFARATIDNLHIGENVRAIPDYLFVGAEMTLDELTLDKEYIGTYAFDRNAQITNLTIGENVKEIGALAFAGSKVTNFHYNAINAALKSEYTSTGVFSYITMSSISIGEGVEAIPDCLFSTVTCTVDNLTFPESVTKIGAYAFNGSGFHIGELTIGENITSIGLMAFADNTIGTLNYNAAEVEIPGIGPSLHHRNPFCSTKIENLCFGDNVKVLPDYLFYCVRLNQDELIIPDGITYIGKDVLSSAADNNGRGKIIIGTLIIGKNVTHIGAWAFGKGTYDKVIVYATESDSKVMPFYYDDYLSTCGSVEIHRNAESYEYFTAKTEADNITLMCEDFETTYGDEYYDEEKDSFVTVITDICTVCGYEKVNEEYADAYTVVFQQPDGTVISRQHVHSGEDAVEPTVPEKAGYEFNGWNRGFTNVTSDITVTAQYRVKFFTVTFKNGDEVLDEQRVAYAYSAIAPENPERAEEAWGRWEFTGWDSDYKYIIQDEVINAVFLKVLNQYEVIFYDAEGNVLSRQEIEHGKSAECPDAPQKQKTEQYTYTFSGWSGDTENITGNTGFYPVYDARTRSYTVTFMDGDTVLDTQTVLYGEAASTPKDPAREGEEEWGTWKFSGWDGDYTNIVTDVIIKAQFEKAFHEYEVIFYDAGGNILSRQTVKHGQSAKAPDAPEKEPTKEQCYPFRGWSGDVTKITADTAFYPTYGTETRSYMVTFMNGDTVYNRQSVKYGGTAITPIEPKKEADAEYSYHFSGWDGDYSFIEGDTIIHALYEKKALPQKDEPEKESGKKEEEPGGSGKDEENGDNGSEPAPDDGGNANPLIITGQTDKAETSVDAILKSKLPTMKSERMESEPEMPEETVTEEMTANEKDAAEDTESTEPTKDKDMDNADRGGNISLLGWILLFIGIILLGLLFLWLLLAYFAKRKVYGTVLYESGDVPCGIQLTLSGKDILETELSADGSFCFENLKKDDYTLSAYDEDGNKIFAADICMESGSEKETFIILSSDCIREEINGIKGNYEVNLTV